MGTIIKIYTEKKFYYSFNKCLNSKIITIIIIIIIDFQVKSRNI
jgi:hypothetical protein